MKKVLTQAILVIMLLFLFSCAEERYVPVPGPVGPAGPMGPQGIQGENGFIFEYSQVSFTAPTWEVILPFPEDFTGYDSDIVMVYLLWEVQQTQNGPLEIWRPLPQQIMYDEGVLQYNFDHSKFDVRLFLNAQFPLDWLGAIDTDDWVVRVAVLPGNFWGRVDPNMELNELAKKLEIALPAVKMEGNYKAR
jgi:hypothetical protein